MRRLPWVIAAACLVGMALVLLLYRREHLVLVAVAQGRNDSQKAADRAHTRLRELERKIELQNQALAAAAKAAADAHKTSAAAATSSAGPLRISFDDMRKDPAFANLWRHEQARMIQRQYGDAILAMKLTPDAEAKLRSLMLERNEASADARQVASDSGLSRPEQFAASQAAEQDLTAQIKALVGDDGYAQLQQGSQIAMQKMMINQNVGADLAAAGTPLTPQQTAAVAQVYSTQNRTTTANNEPDAATGLSPRNLAIYNGVAPLLSQQQLNTMKDSLISDQQQQQFFEQQRAKQGGSASSGIIITTGGVSR